MLVVSCSTCLSIDVVVLPVVKSVRDLGVLVSHDLPPFFFISNIVVKSHKRYISCLCMSRCRFTYRPYVHISRTFSLSFNTTL